MVVMVVVEVKNHKPISFSGEESIQLKKNQSLLSGDPYIHPSIHHCESTRRCRYTTHAQAQFAPCGHTAQVLFGPELVVVVIIIGTCTLATAPRVPLNRHFYIQKVPNLLSEAL